MLFSPRPWGCSEGALERREPEDVFPTPVGMFRRTGCGSCPPSTFSPRPWGCSYLVAWPAPLFQVFPTPVGMFRPRRRASVAASGFPHARGDVPSGAAPFAACPSFSPRPWGCSGCREPPHIPHLVFPTPVGMFRPHRVYCPPLRRFPHARGDVPFCNPSIKWLGEFSPRPWGCSDDADRRRRLPTVFPTPVGMFRQRRPCGSRHKSFPHARGDVPAFFRAASIVSRFSPRPWGCSAQKPTYTASEVVFPTPVGMFRTKRRSTPLSGCFPHARGDVPSNRSQMIISSTFSPRPWGCSV